MSAVTIPVRYGTDRFGKVSGGTLDSDGKTYPQPAADPEWMGGVTWLLVPAEADPAATTYGYRPNGLLSGSRQQLYGKPLDGWVYCDGHGYRWLVKLTLPADLDVTTNAVSIPYSVVRFGQLDPAPVPSYPSSSGTLTLSDIGQDPLTLTQTGYSPSTATWQHTDVTATLVSADSTGANAVIALWTAQDFADLEPFGLWCYPQGYLKVACTASATPGNPPTLALSVLRTLAQTVGVRACDNQTTESDFSYCEVGDTGTAFIEYRTRTIDLGSGISGILAALYYYNDDLVEMTLDVAKVETGEVEAPTVSGCGTYSVTFNQVATRETVYTYTLKRGGTLVASATVTANFTRTTDYTYAPTGYPSCRDELTVTLQIGDDAVTGSSDTTYDDTLFLSSTILASQVDDSGCDWFTTSSEFSNDDSVLGHAIPGEGSFYPTFRRYAWNVIGLVAPHDVGTGSEAIENVGPAMTPAGTIAASSVGTGRYGAVNARTADAVAGVAIVVGYV